MIDTEKPQEVKGKNLWVGISLIVIGILIIVGGIVGYYIEESICPSAQLPCILHVGGGMGLFGVNLLGFTTIIGGIIFRYRKCIKNLGLSCCISFILIVGLAYFLGWLISLIL